MTIQNVFLICGLIVLGATLYSLRREHIRSAYSVSWLTVGLTLVIASLFPGWAGSPLAHVPLDTSHAFLILAGTLLAALLFWVSHLVSHLRDENVLLAQRIALLEFQLNQITQPHGGQEL